MKGVRYQGHYNVQSKRIHDYNNRNNINVVSPSCNTCGNINKQTLQSSIDKFIKSFENNGIVFHEQENSIRETKVPTITYYESPKICGGC